jgi:hypothetical protein
MKLLKSCLDYVESIFRGTKQLKLAEGRTIATILRREYPKLFVPTSGTVQYLVNICR